jgi:hypothetical protein
MLLEGRKGVSAGFVDNGNILLTVCQREENCCVVDRCSRREREFWVGVISTSSIL